MLRARALLLLLLVGVTATACEPPDVGDRDLSGTWLLSEAQSAQGGIELPEPARVTLEFQDGQVGGTAACNHYFAEVSIADDHITVEGIGQTEMACEEPLMSVESAYLSALGDVTSLDQHGDTLVLSGEGVELTFDREARSPNVALTGTTWRLQTLLEGDTASTPAAGSTLMLHDEGTFAAQTGCRELTGSWSREDGDLQTFDVFHPDIACTDDAIRRQDDHVKEVLLVGAFTAEVDGEQLTLRSDGLGLVFTAGDDAGA